MEAMLTRKGAGRASGGQEVSRDHRLPQGQRPEFQKGSTPWLLTQEEDADARLASGLNSVQRAGTHYRLLLTHSPPLEKCLNCTVLANTS